MKYLWRRFVAVTATERVVTWEKRRRHNPVSKCLKSVKDYKVSANRSLQSFAVCNDKSINWQLHAQLREVLNTARTCNDVTEYSESSWSHVSAINNHSHVLRQPVPGHVRPAYGSTPCPAPGALLAQRRYSSEAASSYALAPRRSLVEVAATSSTKSIVCQPRQVSQTPRLVHYVESAPPISIVIESRLLGRNKLVSNNSLLVLMQYLQ